MPSRRRACWAPRLWHRAAVRLLAMTGLLNRYAISVDQQFALFDQLACPAARGLRPAADSVNRGGRGASCQRIGRREVDARLLDCGREGGDDSSRLMREIG